MSEKKVKRGPKPKAISEKKIPLAIYAKRSDIEALGGEEICRGKLLEYWNDLLFKVQALGHLK